MARRPVEPFIRQELRPATSLDLLEFRPKVADPLGKSLARSLRREDAVLQKNGKSDKEKEKERPKEGPPEG